MFAERAFGESCNLTNVEHAARNASPASDIRSRSFKNITHFGGEPLPVFRRIKPEQKPVYGKHSSPLRGGYPQRGQFCEVLHAIDFELQNTLSIRRQSVGLPASGAFLFIESLDPVIVQKASERSIESACAHRDPSVADSLYIFEDGVPVSRLFREAQKNEQNGLCQWRIACYGFRRHVV
jgi:hypothetical protein